MFEELTKQQFDLANAVEKSLTNLKKDSGKHKRATPEARAEIVKKKRAELEASWTTFSQRHAAILGAASPEGQSHMYFTRGFYAQTSKLYLDYEAYLQTLEKMTTELPTTPTTSSTPSIQNPTALEKRPGSEEDPVVQDIPLYETPTGAHPLVRKQRVNLDWLDKCINNTLAEMVVQKPKNYWEYKKDNITQQWNAILSVQSDILVSDEIEDSSGIVQCFERMDGKVQQVIMSLCEKISSSTNASEKIRLPEIKVPVFEDDYKSWTSFHDIYNRLIHENKNIGKTEKMQFLVTSLKGEALKPLQHLTISEINYDSAWEIIKNRYNNKRILVSTQVNNILNLPKITKTSAQDLKRLHDTMMESVRAVTNLGLCTADWGPLLVHILQERMDNETRQLFEQSLERPREVPCFDRTMEFIETRFQSLEMREGVNTKDANNLQQRDNKSWSKNGHANSYHSKVKPCPMCQEQHALYSCKKFSATPTLERFNFAKRENLCTNCLNHDKKTTCASKRTCAKCNKPHHTLLHFEKAAETSSKKPAVSTTNVNVALKSDSANVVINSIEIFHFHHGCG